MTSAQVALRSLDRTKFADEIVELDKEISRLKNALATVLAGLHPDRPYDVEAGRYSSTRRFLQPYDHIFTTNYDLLLYWTLRQTENVVERTRIDDDGFRSRDADGVQLDCVYWDHLKPFDQSIHYLHGALHLYRGLDGLRKLTWVRTNRALIDQIREQLAANYFPLYVSEGSSDEKLVKIHTSDYLSKGLRSLASCGGGLTAYGLSFAENDAHFIDAVVRSPLKRLAVALYGDLNSPENKRTIEAVKTLPVLRESRSTRRRSALNVSFYDASSVSLW
ncbi:DUF4917 family protein [Arthrobacter flavus]|uniref:DUF4917 family protein n=1 Tax=Arthrobacter flavus TaxID=95172 RepID=A0ABW4Q8E9_9MICC